MTLTLLQMIIIDYCNWQQGLLSEKGKLYARERLKRYLRNQEDVGED